MHESPWGKSLTRQNVTLEIIFYSIREKRNDEEMYYTEGWILRGKL